MLGKLFSAALLAGGAVAVSVITKKKNPDFCPECDIKKAIAKAGLHVKSTESYDNGVALTPPMGWSSWNLFRNHIDENLINEIADAMKKSGLLDAGYNYINLDDCWQSSMRDENGRLQGDLTTFPGGIKSLAKQMNKKGFKLGIYSSNGTLTCEDLPASLGNERIDAETFADWGIEYFKYDFCHHMAMPTKGPNIDKIVITGKALNEEYVIEAENGELYGTAKIVNDDKGSFVSNIDSGNGSVKFSFVNIPEDGEYVLTIIIRKAGNVEKYAVVTVNDKDVYSLSFPATNSWTPDGRIQTKIRLSQGDNTIEIKNPIGSKMDGYATQYINMGKELKRATKLYAEKHKTQEKPIVYSICEWGLNKPWKWGSQAGNMWRTTPDIKPIWTSILGIYEFTVRLYDYSCIGGWNDPDMLEVGNGKLTIEENKSHFTLWCMLCAPLILGNDVRKFVLEDGSVDKDNRILQILTDKDLIAVNQDKLGVQCRRMKTNGITDILVKPLENSEVAVCFFNKTNSTVNMSTSISEIVNQSYVDLPSSPNYSYVDLWTKEVNTTNSKLNANVPAHGVVIYRVKAI